MAGAAWESNYIGYVQMRGLWLRRVAFTLSGDRHTGDDLAQNTLIQLYRYWRRIDPGNVDAYARRVLVNLYLASRRRPRRDHPVADLPDSVAPEPASSEDRIDLANALAGLSPRQRAMVVLRYLEDLPVAEVAVLLGAAEGTVKSQTAKALRHLRVAMDVTARERT
jgi:RNA polymerase sigma-70 factor (sigma-E family)